jgi:hypothetical protein
MSTKRARLSNQVAAGFQSESDNPHSSESDSNDSIDQEASENNPLNTLNPDTGSINNPISDVSSNKPTDAKPKKKRGRGHGHFTKGSAHPKVLERAFLLLVTNLQKHEPNPLIDIYLVIITKNKLWKYSTTGMEKILFRHQNELKLCEDFGKLLVHYKDNDEFSTSVVAKDFELKKEFLKLKPLRTKKSIAWNIEPPYSANSTKESKKIMSKQVMQYLVKPLRPIEVVTETITVNNQTTRYNLCVYFLCLLNKITGTYIVTQSANYQDSENKLSQNFQKLEETLASAAKRASAKLNNEDISSDPEESNFDVPMLDENAQFIYPPASSIPILYDRSAAPHHTHTHNQDQLTISELIRCITEIKEFVSPRTCEVSVSVANIIKQCKAYNMGVNAKITEYTNIVIDAKNTDTNIVIDAKNTNTNIVIDAKNTNTNIGGDAKNTESYLVIDGSNNANKAPDKMDIDDYNRSSEHFDESEQYAKEVKAAVKLEKGAKYVGVHLDLIMYSRALQSIPNNTDLDDDFIQYYLKELIPQCKYRDQVQKVVFIGDPVTYYLGDKNIPQFVKPKWRAHILAMMQSKPIHVYPVSNNNHWWLNVFCRLSIDSTEYPVYEHLVIDSLNSEYYSQDDYLIFARKVHATFNGYITPYKDDSAKVTYIPSEFALPNTARQYYPEHTCALWLIHYVNMLLHLPIFQNDKKFENNNLGKDLLLVHELNANKSDFSITIETLRNYWQTRVNNDLDHFLEKKPDQLKLFNRKTNKLFSEESAKPKENKIVKKLDNKTSILNIQSTVNVASRTRSSAQNEIKDIKSTLTKLLKGEINVQHFNEFLVNLYNLTKFKDPKNIAKGYGVKVNRSQPIQPGSIVLFYEGVRHTAAEMNEKIIEYKRKGLGSYVITFEPKKGQTLINPQTKKYYNIVAIDATEADDQRFSLGRYVNDAHSTKQKCNLKLKVYKSQDNTNIYVAMIATKPIGKSTELFFDYGYKNTNALYWRNTAKEEEDLELSLTLSATQSSFTESISLAFVFTLFANINLTEFTRFSQAFRTDARSVNRLDKATLKSYRSFHEYLFGLIENIIALYDMLPKLNKLLKKRINLVVTICYDLESIKELDDYYHDWNNPLKHTTHSYQAILEQLLSIKLVTTAANNTFYVRGVDWTNLFSSFIPVDSQLTENDSLLLKGDILQCFHRYYEGFVGESSNCDFISLADADLVIETENNKEGSKFSEFLFQWLKECASDANKNNSMFQSLLRFYDNNKDTTSCYSEWPLLGGQFCWRKFFLEDVLGATKVDFHNLIRDWIENRTINYSADSKSSSPFNYESDQLFLKEVLYKTLEPNIKQWERNNVIKSVSIHIQYRRGDTSDAGKTTVDSCRNKVDFDNMFESSHSRMEELISANKTLTAILPQNKIKEGYDSYFVDYSYFDASWRIICIKLDSLLLLVEASESDISSK